MRYVNLSLLSVIGLSSCGPVVNNPVYPVGPQGEAGYNSLISLSNDAPTCAQGGVTIVSALDTNRNNTVDVNEDANVAVAVVCHGESATGLFNAVEVLNPCGDAPGVYDEVLLRLTDGTVLASFSENVNGKNTRFSLIGPGTYQTTDGTGCVFTLTSEGRLE